VSPRRQILGKKIIEVSYQVKEEEVNEDFTESVAQQGSP